MRTTAPSLAHHASPPLPRCRFQVGIDCLPLEVANKAPRATVDSWVYVPPPLQEQSLGWYPEWMKAWDGWGMPAYSI